MFTRGAGPKADGAALWRMHLAKGTQNNTAPHRFRHLRKGWTRIILASAMSKNAASTKATGGGGYTFADKVAAAFLAQMLKRKFPIEADFGPITELHFETRDVGNPLDDLMLTLKRGQDVTRCAVSVKSTRQLTKAGFNSEFVGDAWEQWQGGGGSDFDREKDILGLIVGVIDEPTLHEWQELQKQAASTTPERLSARLHNEGQSSAIQRAIFESLRRSPDGGLRDPVATAPLVSRLRVLRFSDDREGDYINFCAEIVAGGTVEEGAKLWSRLLHLASEGRTTGAYFDLPKLVRVLRPDFELQDHPDFRSDWSKVEATAAENISAVRGVLGAGIRLSRQEDIARLKGELAAHNAIVIAGESGSGKSAIVSQLIAEPAGFKRVIWLNGGQLSKTSQAELAQAFSLIHTIPELIANSSAQNCGFVLDAFEKFEGAARGRAIELLRAIREESLVGWKVIVTCQPQSLESVKDALVEAGITDAKRVDFEKPSLPEVFDAVEAVPGMRTLLLRGELQPILRNLMVLDWVLRADVAQRFSISRPWIGETEVIDCIWDRWVGSTAMNLARDALLRALGQREGERLGGAVHVDAIPPSELPLLGALSQEGLIRVRLPSVQFAHDLMGDWARYRILKFQGSNAPQMIKTLAPIPRWGRAIRLYAQSLTEHGSGLDEWRSASAQLAGGDAESTVAYDLFLDGLLLAPNSESLLEQVWPDLIADKGQILHRLLKRLVHVASFPDWRFSGLGDAELAEQSQVWFRIPQPLYWVPVLRALSRHVADLAKVALMQGAEVCALWLRTMPPGMPGRKEASLLALEMAKEAQGLIAEGMFFGDAEKVIYEAVLSAAPEFPEDVTQVALELCERRPEPAHAVERRRAERQRQRKLQEEWAKKNPEKSRKKQFIPPVMGSYRGPLRPPAIDGPLRAVSDGLRAAVLETPALSGLIAVRPEVAREVLLAVCIEEPTPFDPLNRDILSRERFGLADWPKGYPAMYWKGPFLKFLQDAPEQGLDAIVRLVNYATGRWIEGGLGRKPTDDERRKYGFEFEVNGKPVVWVGNANLYAWHRLSHMHEDTAECALMALEKWLYEEIEKGHSIAKWVQYIFEHGESAAFAGLLVSVGLKYPALFTRELQPLLGNFYVYECQTNLALSEQSESWRIAWSREPQAAIKMATDWNRMPHRQRLLRDIAPMLMVDDEGTMRFVSARKAEWAKLCQDTEKSRLSMEFFLARFDPANYTQTPQEDGRVLITMRWPDHLEKIAQRSQEEGRLKSLSLTLAVRARRLLEDQETLQPEDAPKFAAIVQDLANWKDSGEDEPREHYRINSIAGGIAVLVIKHRPWLSQNPDVEQWCMSTLRELKPVEDEYFSPTAINNHAAEAFLGEAGVALLQESDEEWVLRLAFDGVTGAYYSSTLFTLWRGYVLRDKLSVKFGALVNVMVMWSALRHGACRELGPYIDDVSHLAKYRATLFRRYAAGKLGEPLIPLRRVELLGRRLAARIERQSMSTEERREREARRKWIRERRDDYKLDRDMPTIDLEVIQKGFGFLGAMVQDARPGEEALLRQYVQELFDLELRSLPRPDSDDQYSEIQGTPYGPDVWVMGRVTEFIAHANSVETARAFYRPILELGPAGKYWVEDFLQSWISLGLQVSPDMQGFASIWEDMAAYTETLPAWQPGEGNYWSRAESLAVDLMGLGQIGSAVLGDTKYRNLITLMLPTFERWGDRWLKYGSVAAWFANFLRTESGRVLLAQGVKQLAGIVASLPDRDWHHHGLGSLFTDVLSACWRHLRKDVEGDAALRKAFLSILAVLCARQIPEALHLRTKVSEVLASS